MRVSDLGDTEMVSPSAGRKDQHISALETRVDKLVEENAALKKKLKKATKQPKDFVSQETYEKLLKQLHNYWDAEHPF